MRFHNVTFANNIGNTSNSLLVIYSNYNNMFALNNYLRLSTISISNNSKVLNKYFQEIIILRK